MNTAVIVISSHVVRGAVGNRAAVFALEQLGLKTWAVPTVILPWHPGHGPASRIVPDADQFGQLIDDLTRAPWLGEVGAVLTGYFGAESQPEAALRLVKAVKAANPAALYLCDPVIGDQSGLYVPEATARAIRDVLIPASDIATPNRHELAWLTGRDCETPFAALEAAKALGPASVLVTSAPTLMAGATGNLLWSGGQALMAEHQGLPKAPNGTGDLLAALYLGRLLKGEGQALERATAAVFEMAASAGRADESELPLEREAGRLGHPMAMVHMRAMTGAPRKAPKRL